MIATTKKLKIELIVLSIDFDGVLHDKAHPLPNRRMGAPLPDAPAALATLRKRGYTLVIHTTMATSPSGAKAVEDWMKYYKLPYDSITAIKPTAAYYIDDKAIKHINWTTTLKELGVHSAVSTDNNNNKTW